MMTTKYKQPLFWFVVIVFLTGPIQGRAAEPAGIIGALGTLQPKSGFINIVGRPGVAISEISVAVGDLVKEGQVLVVYDNKDELEFSLRLLEAELAELEGTVVIDLALQDLTIRKSRSDLKRSQLNLDNYRKLSKNAQVTSVLTSRKNAVGDADHGLKVTRSKRTKIQKTFELTKAIMLIRIDKAMNEFSSTELRLPVGGTVMEIHKRVGESASGPIITIADLSQMQIDSEVFEGDIARVAKGQSVTAKSKALDQVLSGKVVRVGRRINPDSKVAKVWIALTDSKIASRYIGMEVNVSIQP